MVSGDTYIRAGVPPKVLGLNLGSWTKNRLVRILNHYGVHTRRHKFDKLKLLRLLNRVAQERDLTRHDRLQLETAFRWIGVLPPRKPIIRQGNRSHDNETDERGEVGVRSSETQEALEVQAPQFTGNHQQGDGANDDTESLPVQRHSPINTKAITPIAATTAPAIENVTGIECTVCLERLEPIAFPKRKITNACDHEPDVCLQCLSNSIATQFSNKLWDQIDCPGCGQRLNYGDVKAFASSVIFGRQDLTLQQYSQ